MSARRVLGTITGTAGALSIIGGEALQYVARDVAPRYVSQFVQDVPNAQTLIMVPNSITSMPLAQLGTSSTSLLIQVESISGSINYGSNGVIDTFLQLMTTISNASAPIAYKTAVVAAGNSTQISMGGGEVAKITVQAAQPGYQATISVAVGHLQNVLANAPAVEFARHISALGGDAIVAGAALVAVTVGLFGKDIYHKLKRKSD